MTGTLSGDRLLDAKRWPRPARRAFVTFLMSNDSYLPGCLMTAYGLSRQGSTSRRVCVVTPEITHRARAALAMLYDQIVEVAPIPPPGSPGFAARESESRTGSARDTSASLTRFASLRLGSDGDLGCSYEKVVVLDADLLPLRDFEDLWALPAPAGIINERREHMADIDAQGQLVAPPVTDDGTWIWHNIYADTCPHGAAIPAEITDRVATDASNDGVNGSLVMVAPSLADYKRFLGWAARPEINDLIRHHWPWTHQQAATLYWSGQWTSVDVSYSTLYAGFCPLAQARGLHFAGVKPWSWRKQGFGRRLVRFPDYRLWAEIYVEMLRTFPDLRGYRPLRPHPSRDSPLLGRVHRDVG